MKRAMWLVVLVAAGCASYEVAERGAGTYQHVMLLAHGLDRERTTAVERAVTRGMNDRAVHCVAASSFVRTFSADPVAALKREKMDCIVMLMATNKSSLVGLYDLKRERFVRVYTNGVDVCACERIDLHEFGMNIAATMETDGMLDRKRPSGASRFAEGFGTGLGTAIARRYPVSSAVIGATVAPDAYGLGVNANKYGGQHLYRTEDGAALDPIFQGGVRRNAYGLGAHMDQFGRMVRDGAP